DATRHDRAVPAGTAIRCPYASRSCAPADPTPDRSCSGGELAFARESTLAGKPIAAAGYHAGTAPLAFPGPLPDKLPRLQCSCPTEPFISGCYGTADGYFARTVCGQTLETLQFLFICRTGYRCSSRGAGGGARMHASA